MEKPVIEQQNQINIKLMAKDIGYLTKNFERLEKTVSDGFDEIKRLMEEKYATKEEVDTLKKKVSGYDGYGVWVVRLVGGAMILIILGLVFKPQF